MFIYENGIVVDYVPTNCRPEHLDAVRAHMLSWHKSLPGQAKVRLGRIGAMQGQQPNYVRLDNE
jgi:hypothetical protein